MTRIEANDLLMTAHIGSLMLAGHAEIAGRVGDIYSVQREEIIQEANNEK